ncbi:growth/differentiation factor 9 [Bombina bombina]|uniref:growth/differentiation factor 9 n=1 Tax=Bombina bombina TaxID=8345 RepID=UPI00235AC39B|nr:growth/differentiation factor 9 [Bombina bombina]
MAMTNTLFVCLYYATWLLSFSKGGSGLVYSKEAYNFLPPLIKELSDRPNWKEGTPGPHSVAIKYMKRLYKLSATKEGVPKAHKTLDYNTVRLFTPTTECKPGVKQERKDEIKSLDLSFNVDRVAALEHLLQSVLLYSVSRQFSSSNITCICILESLDYNFNNPICPRAPHTFEFQLHNRQRWVEIDVTSFLQPFISNRQHIHLAFNITCVRNNKPYNLTIEGPFRITRSLPSLLLYLNDTSPKAYQRKNVLDKMEHSDWYQRHLSNTVDHFKKNLQVRQAFRHRREDGYEGTDEEKVTALPHTYNFSEYIKQFMHPQNECELHRFRLRFSQLNWDKWILAPHRYSPDYCKGECPRLVGHKYGSPVHTIVQNIIYEKLDSSIPRPSCVPSEYRPMSVLTIEPDNSIAYKEYQDMIATKCTCR